MAEELNKQPQEGADQYDGSQIQVLEGLEAVRKRPGYFTAEAVHKKFIRGINGNHN